MNGGVWKTTDAGRTWKPIFDDQPTGSIGTIAVAPSDPNIIYVGSGEGLQRPDLSVGDGIYKSTDAGKTWTHLGLRDAQQIPEARRRSEEPQSALRRRARPSLRPERGARHLPLDRRRPARSSGCSSRTRTPAATTSTSIPSNPDIVYATMWEERQGPWENAAWGGTNGGIFKSTDGGTTWKPLTQGLPAGRSTPSSAIAPSESEARIYAHGAKPARARRGTGHLSIATTPARRWARITTDTRPAGRINEAVPITSHPKDPDTAHRHRHRQLKSTDGGKTWVPFKGAPGGEDYQNGWINPDNPDIMLLAADQGAVVTLNGGETWSSWYNQPTAALYHVIDRQRVPVSRLRRAAGQRIGVRREPRQRRRDHGPRLASGRRRGIRLRRARPAQSRHRLRRPKVTRFDRRTGQVSDVGPRRRPRRRAAARRARFRRCARCRWSSPRSTSARCSSRNNVLWKTIDGGMNWKRISPDLTRETWDVPKSVGKYADARQRAARRDRARVIYTIAPSYQDINRIWVGTDDGLIHDDGRRRR